MTQLPNPQSTNLPIPQSTNPYVGPRTFTEKEQRFFFGREREARDLTARIVSERLLLFYAQSGAGKSSLLNARVIPRLRDDERFQALPVGRVSGELPAGVAQVDNIYVFNLMTSLDQSGEHPQRLAQVTLSDFLARLARATAVDAAGQRTARWVYKPEIAVARPAGDVAASTASGPRFALVIDQFEEVITAHPGHWREREGFFRQLNQALLDDPNLWVVLSLREDYVASLDPYAELLFNRLRARFYMERMQVDAALDAIRRPAELAGRPFAPGVAEKLADDLRRVRVAGLEETVPGQYVEPVQLQVVCFQMWENLAARAPLALEGRGAGGEGEITLDDLAVAGDVDQALTQFYEETLVTALADPSAQGVSERQVRAWFDEELITASGTRGLVYQGERATGSLPNAVVGTLQRRFLVRAEARGGDTWIELVHDRFVEPIRASNAAWFPLHLSALQRQAALWDEQGRSSGLLLRDAALAEAEAWAAANSVVLEAYEREFLAACRQAQEAVKRERRQSRRIRQFASIAVILSILALSAFAWSFWLRAEGAMLRAEGNMARAEALKANEKAEIQSRIAQAQVLASTAPELISERFKQDDLARLLVAEAVRINPPEGRSIHWLLDRSLRAVLGAYLVTIMETGDSVRSVSVSPDGEAIFAASGNNILRWSADKPEPLELVGHQDLVTSIAVSPDGTMLASASRDGTFRIWDVADVATDLTIITFAGHTAEVSSVAFHPDGSKIASASGDYTARVWDTNTGEPLAVLAGHTGPVWAVSFSPDGQTLVTASEDGTVRTWDPSSGVQIGMISGDVFFTSAAFSPSGRMLATGGSDFDVKLWDAENLELITSLPCHLEDVTAVAFSPSEDKLASASWDNSICVWDMTNLASPPAAFAGHEEATNSVVFTADGSKLVSGSNDGTVRLWDVDLYRMVDVACNLAGRNMSREEWQRYMADQPYEKTCEQWPVHSSVIEPQVETGRLYALELVKQAQALAEEGDVDGAIAKFEEALALDPSLDIEPQAEAGRLYALKLVEQAQALAAQGDVDMASAKSEEALALDRNIATNPDFAENWNALCWFGATGNQADLVLDACETAVKLAPDDGNIRDSRGLARALTGHVAGAIKDFEFAVQRAQEFSNRADFIESRTAWIAALRAGQNPFDAATLERLRTE